MTPIDLAISRLTPTRTPDSVAAIRAVLEEYEPFYRRAYARLKWIHAHEVVYRDPALAEECHALNARDLEYMQQLRSLGLTERDLCYLWTTEEEYAADMARAAAKTAAQTRTGAAQ